MVRAMISTADSLLPRPKLDYDGGYNVAVKGASVVVHYAKNQVALPMVHVNRVHREREGGCPADAWGLRGGVVSH